VFTAREVKEEIGINMTGQQNNDNRRLEAEIRQAIQSYEPLRALYCPVRVQVRDGRVRLEGTVRTFIMKHMAGELAQHVPGVLEVQNDLVSDTELQLRVAQRLAQHPRTRLLTTDISIRCFLGTVHLQGRVDSTARREAAAKVAAEVEGVRQVVNELVVEG
jgi:osmotically-inducible protein OsmY